MKKKKIKVNSRFIYAAVSILLAATIAFVAIPMVTAKTNGTTTVLRVTGTIERGERISADSVALVEVGSYNLPSDVARTIDGVVGKYAAADLVEGDFLLSEKISENPISSDISLNTLPSGRLAYSVTIKSQAVGLSDKLQKGDIVRVYHYKEQAHQPTNLQYVKVLSVSDSTGADIDYSQPITDADERQQTATVTLQVSAEQALTLTELENDGAIHLALVTRGSEKLADELLRKQEQWISEETERTTE